VERLKGREEKRVKVRKVRRRSSKRVKEKGKG
jgi:hypothetical protein